MQIEAPSPASPNGRPGFALFALGFRPFYLLAGAYAALAVPVWALQYAGWLPGANVVWHAHEMILGYAFAVIAGFLLTAAVAGAFFAVAVAWGIGQPLVAAGNRRNLFFIALVLGLGAAGILLQV